LAPPESEFSRSCFYTDLILSQSAIAQVLTGDSDLPGDATGHAFLWRKGKMQDLGTLPGDYSSYANAINNLSQIVGQSCDINDNCRPFLWENGNMIDLNTLVPTGSCWVGPPNNESTTCSLTRARLPRPLPNYFGE
jgi:probable HAF family extracellular repeat protein